MSRCSSCQEWRRRKNIPGPHDTITRLSALRSRPSYPLYDEANASLKQLTGFGSNPGNLLARSYVPQGLTPGAPLVVVLHGCTQSATSYDRGAGWTKAADQHGFALLFPEQQRSNNPNLCFNWFSSADVGRERGEAASIAQMVRDLCSRYSLNQRRVFITGLSAGGAMTAAMLASYPDVFAGGAVIAGLPFGTATSVPEAFERMRGQAEFRPGQLARLVRSASTHSEKWPVLSVWHGSGDRTVDSSNAAALVEQWQGLHGVAEAPSATETVAGQLRRVWCDQNGVEVIEEFIISDMGHGTPIDTLPAHCGEVPGPFMLDVGISSTRQIIRFWGLNQRAKLARIVEPRPDLPLAEVAPPTTPDRHPQTQHGHGRTSRVQEVIENALRSAGLVR